MKKQLTSQRLLRIVAILALVLVVAYGVERWGGKAQSGVANETSETKPVVRLEDHNVLLIVLDTVGANQIAAFLEGASNPENAKSAPTEVAYVPNIAKLAQESTVFTRAYSSAPWTKPALASIFTSQYPSEHGVQKINSNFVPKVKTLAQLMRERGFATAGVVSHTLVRPGTGYDTGFDHYELVKFKGDVHDSVTSDQVTDRALAVIEAQRAREQKPFFMFAHYFDPHFNYHHHPEFDRSSWHKGELTPGISFRKLRAKVADGSLTDDDSLYMRSLHQEELSFTDHQIGRLLAELEQRGELENAIVILTADHGEEFMEHGDIGHGRSLYDEVIRVPLLVKLPRSRSAGIVRTPVSTLDILPTLMGLSVNKIADQNWRGVSLPKVGDDKQQGTEREGTERVIFAEVDFHAFILGAFSGEHKLILDKREKKFKLFNVTQDPLEQHNLFNRGNPQLQERLLSQIDQFSTEFQGGTSVVEDTLQEMTKGLTPEEVKQLESLGYL